MGPGQTAAAPPLPQSFGIVALPGTTTDAATISGGRPRRRVELAAAVVPIVQELLQGATVADTARSTGSSPEAVGDIARRLIQLGLAGPHPPTRCPGSRQAVGHVTAVIPAHNAAATIRAAIAALDGVPVVVVDDGSSDGTGDIAADAGAHVVRHEHALGPAAARNAGIALVDTEVIALLDSDAAPEPGWLDLLLAHLDDDAVGGVAPRVLSAADESLLGRYEAECGVLDRGTAPGVVRPDGTVTFVSTTALVVRRDLWQALGGFAEDLRFGEDLDFVWRAAAQGRPIVYEPAAVVRHHHRTSLAAHLRNRARYGGASGPLSRRHREHPRSGTAPAVLAAGGLSLVLGLPRLAGALTLASTVLVASRLVSIGEPPVRALSESARSTVRSSRSLAAAVSVPWLPIALLLAIGDRGSRVVVLAAIATRHAVTAAARRGDAGARRVSLPLWVAVRLAEDAALSIGTLAGCLRARTARALLPGRPPHPSRLTSVLGVEVTLP